MHRSGCRADICKPSIRPNASARLKSRYTANDGIPLMVISSMLISSKAYRANLSSRSFTDSRVPRPVTMRAPSCITSSRWAGQVRYRTFVAALANSIARRASTIPVMPLKSTGFYVAWRVIRRYVMPPIFLPSAFRWGAMRSCAGWVSSPKTPRL